MRTGLPKGLQETRCGELASNFLDDCGTDTFCPRDEGYVAIDEDSPELDGTPDYFWDCGRDRICPPPFDTPEEGALASNGLDDDGDGAIDESAYQGPDEDGTEGDGLFQACGSQVMVTIDPLWVLRMTYGREHSFYNKAIRPSQ